MIVLQNISKYYYTDTSVTQALRKINLEFKIGEFVAITGESGSRNLERGSFRIKGECNTIKLKQCSRRT